MTRRNRNLRAPQGNLAVLARWMRRERGAAERADVIAYLEQRAENAETVARRWPHRAEQARDRARQIGVIIDELQAGFHDGAAGARRALLAMRKDLAG